MLFLNTFLLLKKPLPPQRFLFSILLYSCFFAHPGYYGHRALSKFVFGNCLVLKKCFQCLKLCFQQIFHAFNPGRRFLRLCNDIHPCLNLLMNIVVVSDLYYTRPVKKSISTTRTRNRWIFLFLTPIINRRSPYNAADKNKICNRLSQDGCRHLLMFVIFFVAGYLPQCNGL